MPFESEVRIARGEMRAVEIRRQAAIGMSRIMPRLVRALVTDPSKLRLTPRRRARYAGGFTWTSASDGRPWPYNILTFLAMKVTRNAPG